MIAEYAWRSGPLAGALGRIGSELRLAVDTQALVRVHHYYQRYHYGVTTLKLIAVGNSMGIVLPKEILERLRVGKGDRVYVIETPDGIELTPYDPELAVQLEVAEQVMRKDRDALKKLAR